MHAPQAVFAQRRSSCRGSRRVGERTLAGKRRKEAGFSGRCAGCGENSGVRGMQSGLSSDSMAMGVMQKALYSSYTACFNARLNVYGAAAVPTLFLGLGQRHALLALIFTTAVLVGYFTRLIRFKKQHLCDTLIRINLCRQRCGVREFQSDVPFPLRFKRGDVDDNTAARIGRFAETDGRGVARAGKVFDRARQGG